MGFQPLGCNYQASVRFHVPQHDTIAMPFFSFGSCWRLPFLSQHCMFSWYLSFMFLCKTRNKTNQQSMPSLSAIFSLLTIHFVLLRKASSGLEIYLF